METIYKENQLNNYEVNILGKKWNSIAQCCEYYKISYSSVCVYKWKERCNNDTAVLHFIESKKRNSFYYRKKKWNNIKECCIYYDLDYNLVIAYKSRMNVSPEEAIDGYIRSKKKREFPFQGVTYKSFSECCHAYGVRTRNAIYDIRYHIVIMTASRKKIINQDIGESIKWKIQRLIEEREGEVLQYDYQEDYIHIYAVFRPDCSMTREIALLKGSLTCYLKQTYEVYINQNVPSGSIWEQGYFISSSDEISKETINQYLSWKIRNSC